jgi:hypothetical protein
VYAVYLSLPISPEAESHLNLPLTQQLSKENSSRKQDTAGFVVTLTSLIFAVNFPVYPQFILTVLQEFVQWSSNFAELRDRPHIVAC